MLEIHYEPGKFSKYAIHAGQLSNDGERALAELDSRIEIITEHVIRPEGVYGANLSWRDVCVLMQRINLHRHLCAFESPKAADLARQIHESGHLSQFLSETASGKRSGGKHADANRGQRAVLVALYRAYQTLLPAGVRQRVGFRQKQWVWNLLGLRGDVLRSPGRLPASDPRPSKSIWQLLMRALRKRFVFLSRRSAN